MLSTSSCVKQHGEDDVTRATRMDATIIEGTSDSLLVVNAWDASNISWTSKQYFDQKTNKQNILQHPVDIVGTSWRT